MSLITEAREFATKAHEGQLRNYNGSPYILHPERVAKRFSRMAVATNSAIAAAWLHDVVEDCGVTGDEIGQRFGATVRDYVLELTNPSKGSPLNRAARKQIDREHIAGASKVAKTIKLIDRIDNLSEMQGCGDSFLAKYKEESRLLLDVLRGTDAELEAELESLLT